MANALRKDLEAFFQAQLEQMPIVHRSIVEGQHLLDTQTALETLSEFLTIQRELIYRVADQVDELWAAIERLRSEGQ